MNRRNYFIIYGLTVLLAISSVSPIFAQNKSNFKKPKTDSTLFLLDNKKELKSNTFLIKGNITKLPQFKTPQNINKNFKPSDKNYYEFFNHKPKHNFSINSKQPVESDVLVRHYFNGKVITNKENPIKTKFSLGTLYSSSKYVRLEFRDFQLVDGDRIKVYLNGKILSSNIKLDGLYYTLKIDLDNGYNRIDIKALSAGFSGPNTAEIKVYDDQGEVISNQKWNINVGEFATLSIIKK